MLISWINCVRCWEWLGSHKIASIYKHSLRSHWVSQIWNFLICFCNSGANVEKIEIQFWNWRKWKIDKALDAIGSFVWNMHSDDAIFSIAVKTSPTPYEWLQSFFAPRVPQQVDAQSSFTTYRMCACVRRLLFALLVTVHKPTHIQLTTDRRSGGKCFLGGGIGFYFLAFADHSIYVRGNRNSEAEDNTQNHHRLWWESLH